MSILDEYFAYAKAHPEQFVNPPEGGFVILLVERIQIQSWVPTTSSFSTQM